MSRLSSGLALFVFVALAASGCGGDGKNGPPPDFGNTSGKPGGVLTVLSAEDVQTLDPGAQYFTYDYQVLSLPTQRALYGWRPRDTKPTPDLAAALPVTSDGGKTVTIKIKPDIRYSPPLQSRTVKSADVKYAIERTFLPSVGNFYAGVYYNAIRGSKAFASGKATEITGIETPDDTTLVLKLARPIGVISNGESLSLPGTVPVPEDYARRYDAKKRSTYGSHQVFTGPYMISGDGKGKLTGYKAGRSIELVRNPSWDRKSDYRPAYLDRIRVLAGNDIDIASRRILSGRSLASGDFAAPPVNVLRSALSTRRDQLAILPSQGNRFIALNTTIKPFTNVNVRRAAAAAIDRTTLRLTRGGETLGPIATHFLPPGMSGFAQGGGAKGTFAFMKNPKADLALARRYMKKAGYPSGRYSGPPLLMVGSNQPPSSNTSEAVRDQLSKLGFKFDFRLVDHAATLGTTCGAPEAKVAVCPDGAWIKDFFDPQSMLDPVFNGDQIHPESGGPNWAQVDDAELNARLEIATSDTDPALRARDYGEIDRTVTGRAYVIPWLWDNQINSVSEDVKGVVNKFSSAWDLSYSSLK
jgi:peptide/nickel transport system substrate-binding protein